MREARPENIGERFGDPGGPDPGEATSSAASASSMRERAAQELSPDMGRMGAEDPSRALPDEPQLAPAYYATRARGWRRDIWALLHPPYTAWHLSYVLIGAGLPGRGAVTRLFAPLVSFFPVLTAYFAQTGRISIGSVAAAAAAYALAFGQRALSTPARQLRRKTRSVTGTLTLSDGSEQRLDEPALLHPLESALRAFSWGVVLLGLGLVAAKLV